MRCAHRCLRADQALWVEDLVEHEGLVVLAGQVAVNGDAQVVIVDDANGEQLWETSYSAAGRGYVAGSARAVSVGPQGGVVIGGTLYTADDGFFDNGHAFVARLEPELP